MASGLSRSSTSRSIAMGLDTSAETSAKGRHRQAPARRVQRDDEGDAAAARYDVFINHRGLDTKRTVARLLYERLQELSGGAVRSFLDNMSMRPGDHLEESIFGAIRECGVAVAIFSRHYCDSDYCLRELAALVEARKTIVPVFYDVEPSELVLPQDLIDSGEHPPRDIERFRFALREAKRTVGIGRTYGHATDDLAELVSAIANAVMERIEEMKSVQPLQMIISRL